MPSAGDQPDDGRPQQSGPAPAADLKAELARMLPALAALRTASGGTSVRQYVTEARSHGARAQAAAVRAALGLAAE
ncbi:hypothetical protein [Kitasatospora sp. NPDC085464]|uniref:hypothetical protein n=1 Tax=Kitasatospora sp. NPDC085464 TaxID=3364063 RepID=UPI0037C77792